MEKFYGKTDEEFEKYLDENDLDACDGCPCRNLCKIVNECLSDDLSDSISCVQTFRISKVLNTDAELYGRFMIFFNNLKELSNILSNNSNLHESMSKFFE